MDRTRCSGAGRQRPSWTCTTPFCIGFVDSYASSIDAAGDVFGVAIR